jgi:hypothetical protein
MATFDVSDAFDASFFDMVVVNRIDESIDQYGRVVRGATQIETQAVVVATGPDDLKRLPEEQYAMKAISLYSPFRFQGPAQLSSTGTRQHPDEILWHGSTYVVTVLDDYTDFGRGFVYVVAVSIDPVDPPPYANTVVAGHA